MRYLRVLGLALILTALLFPARVGVAQERGITRTEIIIGSTVPLSGPAAFWGSGVGGGIDAYLRSINDAGGIHGRKFRTVLLDDSYLPPRAAVNVRELVERHNVFAIVGMIGTANAFATRGYILESKVLWITPTTNDIWAGLRENRKYLFVTYPSYHNEGRILTEYAAKNLGTKSIAVFYQNDEYGLGLLRGVKYGAAQAKTVKFAGQASYEVTDADVSAQAVRLRATGADTVFIAATPTQGALIVREMAKLGWRPKLLATFTLGDPIMFRLAGEAWNDIYLSAYFPLPGSGDPKIEETLGTLFRYNAALRNSPYNALAGVSFIEPLVEALRRVGPDVTKDKVVAAMESIRNWDGAVARGITFTKDRHQGLNRIYVVRSSGGQYVKVTDWISYPTQY